MRRGERVALTGMEIEVTTLTEDGRPGEVAVRFAVQLDDSSLRWLRWVEKGGYEDFPLPGVGAKTDLPASRFGFQP